MTVQPIPEGYHTVTPYLITRQAAQVIEFAKAVFGAEEKFRMDNADGTVDHAEIIIGDSVVMLGEANERNPAMPTMLHLYVEDVDAVYERAMQAGATSTREPKNEFYGDRTAGIEDMSGNRWWIATHVEDLSPEEFEARVAAQGA
jgi:uncharacterized glyoxalase superfamily protein PhnB